MSNNDGKIDFSKYSDQDLTESLLRIDKFEFPLNHQAATKEFNKRNLNNPPNREEQELYKLAMRLQGNNLVFGIAFIAVQFFTNIIYKSYENKSIPTVINIISLYVFSIALWTYNASFKCPVCNVKIGAMGVSALIRRRKCVHCEAKVSS